MLRLFKWWSTIKYFWTKSLAYRINFFLEIIGPILVFFFVNFNLWTSIYGGDQDLLISGYTYEQMISYLGWGLVVGMLGRGHMSGNLAEDIRLGRISSYLIYPFDFWEYQTASFLGFQVIQIISSCLALFVLWFFNILSINSLSTLFLGLGYCLYVSLFWFLTQYLIGLLAFWLDETWILRVIFMLVTGFLAGSYFPLDLYPAWLQNILEFMPFAYIQYYPVKILMGETHLLPRAILMISIWMLPLVFLLRLTWKSGLKRYTAAGM
jgi:ABC-2 type transport system permease protein